MICKIIIGILIFNAGFVIGSGWNYIHREPKTWKIPKEGDIMPAEDYAAIQKMIDQAEKWRNNRC